MRCLLNIVIGLTVAAALAGAAWFTHASDLRRQQREMARAEVHRFQQQIVLHSQMVQSEGHTPRHPPSIDPKWFEGDLPVNPLLAEAHPWLEVASSATEDMLHPPHRIASAPWLARFWYNPSNGCVRARVPSALSDQESLEMYNFINDCETPASMVGEPPTRP